MTMSGLIAGFPDLVLFCARGEYHGLAIELKRPNIKGHPKGVVSERQARVLEHLSSRFYKTAVCFGFESAKLEIENYLGPRYESN